MIYNELSYIHYTMIYVYYGVYGKSTLIMRVDTFVDLSVCI